MNQFPSNYKELPGWYKNLPYKQKKYNKLYDIKQKNIWVISSGVENQYLTIF